MSENMSSTFLVEIPSGSSFFNFQASVVCPESQSTVLLQAIETGVKPNSYWTDWGGHYNDLPSSPFFTLFIGDRFLSQVTTFEDLLALPYTSFVFGSQVFFHIPNYLWQIENILSRIEQSVGFSTNVSNPFNPSDDIFNGVRYPVRMKVPNLALNLSDPVNGINLSPTFTIELLNNDGFFDSQETSSILNNPITVLRSTSQPATYDSFSRIRVGEIENIKLDMRKMSIVGADILRTLEQPALRTLQEAGLKDDSGDTLPLIFGSVKDVKMQILSESQSESGGVTTTVTLFYVCDPEYFYGFEGDMRAANGELINPSTYSVSSFGIVTHVSLSDMPEELRRRPSTMDVRGKSGVKIIGDDYAFRNSIGSIIVDEVVLKSGIPFTETFWNLREVEKFAQVSSNLNFVFTSGSVKNLISAVLTNDMAFLIQQNNGALTIRRWVEDYAQHTTESWTITKEPQKSFSDFKYFYSSVIIDHKGEGGPVLNNSVESKTIAKWKKRVRKTFTTSISSRVNAEEFSNDLLARFANRAQIWTVALGKSTADFELLDSLILPMNINGRELSEFSKWKIIGVNPSQDSLILEEDSFEPIVPDSKRGTFLSHPSNFQMSGLLSHIMVPVKSGTMSQNTINK